MKPIEAIAHFKTVKALVVATGLTHQAIYYWKKVDRIPLSWQYRLKELSRGKLKVDAKAGG